jgi:hypothetical protein
VLKKYSNLVIPATLLFLSVGVICATGELVGQDAFAQKEAPKQFSHPRYDIQLKLDFDGLSYSGTEKVTWTNRTEQGTSVLYFHLYSNLRPEQPLTTNAYTNQVADADEPSVQITEVLSAAGAPIPYSMDDQGTTLRVSLREQVAPGKSTEVVIGFKGNVPEVDADETGLTTHVVKQVSAALRGEKEVRRPRNVNFRCKGVMLLGTFYPVLAVQDGEQWLRKLEPSVGDVVFNEVADYHVKINAAPEVMIFTSAAEDRSTMEGARVFSAESLRDFAIVAGRTLRSEQREVGETTIRSVFVPEHATVGKRVLGMAENAVKIFTAKFGALPLKTITITEAPLVAGLGSTEFSGLEVIAAAYYIDFDSPAVRALPEIIREQRPSVEESLEWSVAHLIAHQWWGVSVGSDPARMPVLDEGLSSWSALLYFRQLYGEPRAASIREDQLRGVYRLYRTFGGDDMNANRPSRDYRNTFQYAAVVTTKGALMFVHLEELLGQDRLLASLRNYYKANLLEIAELDDLRGAVIAEAPINKRRVVGRTFNRWLATKSGDEDIAKPDPELATSLGLPARPNQQKDRNALSAFARVGKFFWQQMTRIR